VVIRKRSDFFLGILLVLIIFGLAVSGFLPPIIRVILALPFVFIAPGYALMRAIFPEQELKALERFLFVIGLSLGVLILSGLALNITPWGLQATSWLVLLSLITLVASAIAIWRRRQISAKESTPERLYVSLRQVGLLGCAIVLVGFSLKLTLTPRSPDKIPGYTSLWILPYSQEQPGSFIIGIKSQEIETTHYSLRVTFNGQLQQEWPDIGLAPGAQSLKLITMPAEPGLMEVILYRDDNPEVVYRRVSITIKK
jgi:hypothetical protein